MWSDWLAVIFKYRNWRWSLWRNASRRDSSWTPRIRRIHRILNQELWLTTRSPVRNGRSIIRTTQAACLHVFQTRQTETVCEHVNLINMRLSIGNITVHRWLKNDVLFSAGRITLWYHSQCYRAPPARCTTASSMTTAACRSRRSTRWRTSSVTCTSTGRCVLFVRIFCVSCSSTYVIL